MLITDRKDKESGDILKVVYKELSLDEINLVKLLWENLNKHHIQCSEFSEEFKKNSFQERINRIRNKKLKITAAYKEDKIIGYSITSISSDDIGELDSIFVEKEYRSTGVGKKLIEMSLDWLDKNNVDNVFIIVAVGNENVLDFYEQFGFKPRAYKLKRLLG